MMKRKKKREEKTTPFGVSLMRSQVLYRAAQGSADDDLSLSPLSVLCNDEKLQFSQIG